LLQHFQVTGEDVQAVKIMKLRIAVVEPNEDLISELVADLLHLDLRTQFPAVRTGQRFTVRSLNLLKRRQVPLLQGPKVHHVQLPVLVATKVLQIKDVFARIGPEIGPNAAQFVGGNGLCSSRIGG